MIILRKEIQDAITSAVDSEIEYDE